MAVEMCGATIPSIEQKFLFGKGSTNRDGGAAPGWIGREGRARIVGALSHSLTSAAGERRIPF